jgi:hypothetical protein
MYTARINHSSQFPISQTVAIQTKVAKPKTFARIMDIYICELPNSEEEAKPDSPLIFELASSKPSLVESTQAIQRKVERAAGLNSC